MNGLRIVVLLIALPGAALAAEQCALPGPAAIPVSTAAAVPPGSPSAAPAGLGGLPFAERIAKSGAQILDFGQAHGLRLIGARSGKEFRVFSMLPDGSAAVEGAPIALTVDQLTRLAGETTQLGRSAGFEGLFVRSGPQFQVFYASPDGQVVVPGILRDAYGKNLTRAQVQGVPGAIPAVEIQSGATAPSAPPALVAAEPALTAVKTATFGSIGPSAAPEVFMMIDPQCIYSVRAYQQLQPYAAAGKIKLSVVPVSVLDYEDQGSSTRSALALLAKPADAIPTSWQRGDTNGAATPEAHQRLAANMAVAEAIGLKGTPTLLWKGRDGKAARIDGVPTDIAALIASVGG